MAGCASSVFEGGRRNPRLRHAVENNLVRRERSWVYKRAYLAIRLAAACSRRQRDTEWDGEGEEEP
jgi:hypothetical protein